MRQPRDRREVGPPCREIQVDGRAVAGDAGRGEVDGVGSDPDVPPLESDRAGGDLVGEAVAEGVPRVAAISPIPSPVRRARRGPAGRRGTTTTRPGSGAGTGDEPRDHLQLDPSRH